MNGKRVHVTTVKTSSYGDLAGEHMEKLVEYISSWSTWLLEVEGLGDQELVQGCLSSGAWRSISHEASIIDAGSCGSMARRAEELARLLGISRKVFAWLQVVLRLIFFTVSYCGSEVGD